MGSEDGEGMDGAGGDPTWELPAAARAPCRVQGGFRPQRCILPVQTLTHLSGGHHSTTTSLLKKPGASIQAADHLLLF